ncbi:unnamed protein product [Lasius platythorax]|uniref:Uncharacterized protein n=1 Tax=Lasius platythorax TaxID=488582 RepID=A0AAV2N5B3_9HYME
MDITGTPGWLASPRLTDKEEEWFLSEMGFQPMTDGSCPLRTLLGMAQFNLFPLLSRAARVSPPGFESGDGTIRNEDGQRTILIIYTAARFDRSRGSKEREDTLGCDPNRYSPFDYFSSGFVEPCLGFAEGSVPRWGCEVTSGRCPPWNALAQAN